MDKKPKMGLDVDMTSSAMEKDEWATNLLKDIGKSVTQKECNNGMEYVGTIAMHLMVEKRDIMKPKYRISTITQIADNGMSESVAALAFSNGTIATRRYFNPDLKLGRRGDKR